MASLVLFCLGTYLDALPAADLEIRTYLHSGSSNPEDPLGVFVYGDAHSEAYIDVLRYENVHQNYRFVSELDVRHLEIAPAGTPFKLEKLVVSTEDILNSVKALKVTLDELKKRHPAKTLTEEQVFEKIKLISRLQDQTQVNAVRHVREMTYLLNRYDAILRHISRMQDIIGYTNQQKTPADEALAISRTLCGLEANADDFVFDLTKLDLETLHDVDVQSMSVPWKLTAPQDQAGQVVEFLLSKIATLGSSRISAFSHRLNVLHSRYVGYYFRYAFFNVGERSARVALNRFTRLNERGMLGKIRLVQYLRQQSLNQYQKWKIPFVSDGLKLFSIYVHDPEGRDIPISDRMGFRPFDSISAAHKFLAIVTACFQRTPKSFFAGRLNTVLLSRGDGDVRGVVLDSGRAMMLTDNGFSRFSVMQTVRHECGHVLDCKMGRRFRKKLRVIRHKYERIRLAKSDLPHKKLLLRVFDAFPGAHPESGCDLHRLLLEKLLRIHLGVDRNELLNAASSVREYEHLELAVRNELSDGSEITKKIEEMDVQIELDGRKRDRRFSAMLSYGEMPGFSSDYATTNVVEEVAELAQHIVSDAYRAALFARESDKELYEKVTVWLDEFGSKEVAAGEKPSDRDDRLVLAEKWKQQLNRESGSLKQPKQESGSLKQPITAVTVSSYKVENLDIFESTEQFVGDMIRHGREVSWLHIYRASDMPSSLTILLMAESTKVPRSLHFFGISTIESLYFRILLESLVQRSDVAVDGNPLVAWNQVFAPGETVHRFDGCPLKITQLIA